MTFKELILISNQIVRIAFYVLMVLTVLGNEKHYDRRLKSAMLVGMAYLVSSVGGM